MPSPITASELWDTVTLDDEGIWRCIPEGAAMLHIKVEEAFPPESRNHVVTCSDYDTLYVTSDIHSDLRKFLQMLLLNNLLRFADGSTLDPYSDDIYALSWLEQVEWRGGERTLLVLVGDIVDGRREHRGRPRSAGEAGEVFVNTPDDTMGAFELLLFVLLYNLRISARAQSSEVLFTIGNHELMSIIQPSMGAFDMYAADTTRSFFGEGMIDVEDAMAYRSGVLLPFLHMSPYYFIRMEHGGTQEIVCVHGGLHREDGDGSHLEELERLQQRINATDGTLAMMQETVLGGDEGPLWLRTYSEAKDGLCHRLTPAPLLTIVGHCITGTGFPRFQTLLENPIYYGCDETSEIGCVLMDCNDASGAPRLLFVDTGSGKSQRTPSHGSYQEIPNKTRLAQMIKCTHDSDLVGARYFNQIERVAKVNPAGYSVSGLDMGGTLLYRALSKESALPPPPANAAVMAPPRPSSLSSAAFMTPPPPSLSSASVELPSSGSARPRLPAGWGLPPPPPPPSSAAAIAANAALLKPSSMSSSSSSPSRPRLPAAWALPAPALLPEVPANATVTAPPPTRPASARARLPAGWGAPTGGRRTRAHRRTRRRAAKRTRRHRK